MKKIAFALMASMMMGTVTVSAQTTKEIAKERKEIVKASKKELNAKASKDARKEAKKLAKQGWMSSPGSLPLEKQLDRSYMMFYEFNEDMSPKFLMGEAMSIGENYDAAKMQALELAKQNLAEQIQTELTALAESEMANDQLSAEEAASITRTVMTSKNLITQSIGRVITVVEVYRTKENKNKEVLVRIAYDSKQAQNMARKALEEELK